MNRKFKEEKESQETELRGLLAEKNLLLKNGELVDISRMNKEYFSEKFLKQKEMSFKDFFNCFEEHKKISNSSLKPKKYVELICEKPDYKIDRVRVGVQTIIPIHVTTEGGKPSTRLSVGYRREEIGEPIGEIEAGLEYRDKETRPYLAASKAGFFIKIMNKAKEISTGITQGIFSITSTITGEAKTLFSATLGPWIGNIHLKTGQFSGTFSWITTVLGVVNKGLERGIRTPSFHAASLAEIKKDNIVLGENGTGIKISKIIKKEENKIYFQDSDERTYVAEIKQGEVCIKEKLSFWRKLGRSVNPINIAKDLWDITLVAPYKKVEDIIDSFKDPSKVKLSKDEKEKYNKKLNDALKRGNLGTAHYLTNVLIENSNGKEKAEYMLKLDNIEWKFAHSGFFIGYIAGRGFGNKRQIVEKSITKRIEESVDIIYSFSPKKEDLECAYYYLNGKIQFESTKKGKMIPTSFSPVELKDRILKAVERGKEKYDEISKISTNINFRNIRYEGVAGENYKNFLNLLQKMYNELLEHKRELSEWYTILTNENEEFFKAFYEQFKKNFDNQKFLRILNNVESLEEQELKTIYEHGLGIEKR